MKANLFLQTDNILGEGPVWDEIRNELVWVDIERNQLCFCNVVTGKVSEIEMDSKIGAAVVTNVENVYLVALQSGLKFYNRKSGSCQSIANPEEHLINNRFNDGKCDALGRFWIGSMDLNAKSNQGNLYCLDENLELSKKLSRLSISNGLAWNSDSTKMYFIDTATYKVFCFDYDIKSTELNNRKEIIDVPETHGAPDGMCIDAEGMLWIAHWGGANVSRWNPNNGELLQKIDVPALNVTSCCFGGSNLDTLFITTSKLGMTVEEAKLFPLSGSVFSIKPGVKGCKSIKFKTTKFQL